MDQQRQFIKKPSPPRGKYTHQLHCLLPPAPPSRRHTQQPKLLQFPVLNPTKLSLRRRLRLHWTLTLLLVVLLCCISLAGSSQLSWTPIYVDTSNQLDLWTVKEKGCQCPTNAAAEGTDGTTDCACCVEPGGCLCSLNTNRCAQCGLENHCQRFCNVSISSWEIEASSGLSWVQLKSPALQGPTSCWWRLQSKPGQRIEVQVHRLISVGAYDNSTQKCSKGFVQFSDGDVINANPQAIQLCAENSRFSPPVVMFADKGIATLLLRISGKTSRSQLLAYVSFSSVDDPIVGDPTRGGRPKPHSVCDWVYDNCWSESSCILASPNYPGLSPPFRRCRYLLQDSNSTTKIQLKFHALNFPKPKLCSTHHLAIWKNISSAAASSSPAAATSSSNLGPPWKTLCEETESVINIDGTTALLEFRSGSTAAPFIHNGFRASVLFVHGGGHNHGGGGGVGSSGSAQVPVIRMEAEDRDGPLYVTQPIKTTLPATTSTVGAPAAVSGATKTSGAISSSSGQAGQGQGHRPHKKPFPTQRPTESKEKQLEYETPMGNQRGNGNSGLGSKGSNSNHLEGVYPITCGHIFEGEFTRGNVFRLLIPKDLPQPHRSGSFSESYSANGGNFPSFGNTYRKQSPASVSVPIGPFKCQIEFRGRPADIVQLAAFNYNLRGSNCSTVVEIYDMPSERTSDQNDRLLGKLCGPTIESTASSSSSSSSGVRRFTSSHSRLALVTLIFPQDEAHGNEFLEGAFRFHDESVEGTVKPMSSCEVVYYGVTSSPKGSIAGPPDSPLLRLSAFPLICGHSFLPASANQTITLTINHAGHESPSTASSSTCRTICTGAGCFCEPTANSPTSAQRGSVGSTTEIGSVDHLLLLSGSMAAAAPIACFCGYFKDLLPMTFESHVPLALVYHATKPGHEFTYSVGFEFKKKTTCDNFTIHPPSSSKRWKEILGASIQQHAYASRHRNFHYTYFQCSWPVVIPTRFKLVLHFLSEENEDDCRTWNLTVWAGNNLALDPTPDDLLFTFCPKQGRKEFQLPNSMQNAFIKLAGVTPRAPQFEVRWKYIDILLGSGFLTERSTTNSDEPAVASLNINLLTSLLFVVFIIHIVLFSSPNMHRPSSSLR